MNKGECVSYWGLIEVDRIPSAIINASLLAVTSEGVKRHRSRVLSRSVVTCSQWATQPWRPSGVSAPDGQHGVDLPDEVSQLVHDLFKLLVLLLELLQGTRQTEKMEFSFTGRDACPAESSHVSGRTADPLNFTTNSRPKCCQACFMHPGRNRSRAG